MEKLSFEMQDPDDISESTGELVISIFRRAE